MNRPAWIFNPPAAEAEAAAFAADDSEITINDFKSLTSDLFYRP
jgi:hypothetical protein